MLSRQHLPHQTLCAYLGIFAQLWHSKDRSQANRPRSYQDNEEGFQWASRVLIGVRPLLPFLSLFVLSLSRSSRPLPAPLSHSPSPLEHRSRLSDQPEPTFSPLQHFIHLLELLLTFVFVYLPALRILLSNRDSVLQALPPLKVTSRTAYSLVFTLLSILPLPYSHYYHGHDFLLLLPVFHLCRLAQYSVLMNNASYDAGHGN